MNTVKTENFDVAIYAKGDPASARLAIVTPGRLDTKDYLHNISLVDYLATRGFYAISFDPPGTWESPGSIDLYTTTNCIRVVGELIEHFGNKPTLLAGHSRGGTIAMLAAPKNPHVTHFIPIMSYYGAPSAPEPDRIENDALVSYRDLPPGTTKSENPKRFDLPLAYFKDGQQYDALEGLKTCIKPKLFFYGIQDVMNDPGDVKVAYEYSAGPKMMHPLNSEHDYRLHPEMVAEVNEVVGQFLDKYPYFT